MYTLDCGRAVLNSDLKKISLPSQERYDIYYICIVLTYNNGMLKDVVSIIFFGSDSHDDGYSLWPNGA